LRKFRDFDIDVVCIGGEPSVDPEFLSGLPQNVSVRHIILDDDDLARAYCGAESLVFPSLYEGFGLPLIEAMASGTPVLASHEASIPEVLGGAGLLLDPRDVSAWRDAIIRIVNDESLRSDLRARGLARAATYTWQRTARLTLNVYREAVRAA